MKWEQQQQKQQLLYFTEFVPIFLGLKSTTSLTEQEANAKNVWFPHKPILIPLEIIFQSLPGTLFTSFLSIRIAQYPFRFS